MSLKDNVFLNDKIDIDCKILNADKSAFSVEPGFPLLKLQFIYTFLNVSHIFVTDTGQLVGLITREEFVKKLMSN